MRLSVQPAWNEVFGASTPAEADLAELVISAFPHVPENSVS